MRTVKLFVACVLLLAVRPAIGMSESTIELTVDLRDAPRKILHAEERVQVSPGSLTLAFPKWVPSEHLLGPIAQQAGLSIDACAAPSCSQPIRWQRDPVDLYLYHIDIPKGIHQLLIKSDFITGGSGSAAGSTDASMASLDWNTVILYPYAGPTTNVRTIRIVPAIILPAEWRSASALDPIADPAQTGIVHYKTVSLEHLVDSPVLAGRNFREILLAPEIVPKHYLDLTADKPEDLAIDQMHIDQISELVRQTGKLFQSRHYNSFHMLVALSDYLQGSAVDHHESLDEVRPAKYVTDSKMLLAYGSYLPHDFIHSWNGKYRRPAELTTPNYQVPQITSNLWIYEGLTDYLSGVLAVRSGIWTEQQFLEQLAGNVADFAHRPGRAWRNLEDTSTMAPILWSVRSSAYDNWRRNGYEFYGEGALIWLDVDVTIRNLSGGRKSLDDFLRLFYGPAGDSGPDVVPYDMPQLVEALNSIVPNDWASFFDKRVQGHSSEPVLQGIRDSGFQLVYGDTPLGKEEDFEYSIAMSVRDDGTIVDVLKESLADQSGFSPGVKILSVNGTPFTIRTLKSAIRDAKTSTSPIQFQLNNTGVTQQISLKYHGGEQFPSLIPLGGAPDRLAEITRRLE